MKYVTKMEICTPMIVLLIGFFGVLYLKTIKHLFISRCTDIKCCCMACKRNPITDIEASHLAETTEKLEMP